MSVKYFVGLASAGSAVVIAVSLLTVAILFNDINSLYDEVLDEMDEFKYIANEAWKGMMEIQTGNGKSADVDVASIFGRHKRQYDAGVSGGNAASGGACNCAARANKCPKGPPGPPGSPGTPGGRSKRKILDRIFRRRRGWCCRAVRLGWARSIGETRHRVYQVTCR